MTNFKVCSSYELFSLCRLDHLLKSECPSVPTVSHEDKRGGGDSVETVQDSGVFSFYVFFSY